MLIEVRRLNAQPNGRERALRRAIGQQNDAHAAGALGGKLQAARSRSVQFPQPRNDHSHPRTSQRLLDGPHRLRRIARTHHDHAVQSDPLRMKRRRIKQTFRIHHDDAAARISKRLNRAVRVSKRLN